MTTFVAAGMEVNSRHGKHELGKSFVRVEKKLKKESEIVPKMTCTSKLTVVPFIKKSDH